MSVAAYIKDLFQHPERYTKFWIAFGVALLNAIALAIPDSPYLAVIINFAGALGVFLAPNKK